MIHRVLTFAVAALLLGVPAAADQLEKGDRQLRFDLAFSTLDFDAERVGDSDKIELTAGFGYMLTDHHEIGAAAGWFAQNGSDSTILLLYYTYNFRAGQILNPYVAGQFLTYQGDLADLFDIAYGVEVGVKVFPWSHAGFLTGLNYREVRGAEDIFDATEINLFSGLLVKF